MLISQQKITPRIGDLLGFFKKQEEGIVREFIPQKHLRWVGSGREALKQILLHIGSEKEVKLKVGLPAYTCHVVFDAVRRAGCEVVFYDSGVVAEIDDIEEIISNVDVLVVCYNLGFLPGIEEVAQICEENNVVLVEDCAQALGAKYKGELVGGFGDYAFYSFGISKNIGFCGGLIGSKEKIENKSLKRFPKAKILKSCGEVIISSLFFNKSLYPVTRKLLRKELGKEQEALNYGLPQYARRVVLQQFGRYIRILEKRKKNGLFCLKELENVVDLVAPKKGSDSSWLYFTILSKDEDSLRERLLREGAELSRMETFKCLDGKGKKALRAGKEVLTFALYRDFDEVKLIVDKIKKVCR